MEVDLQAFRDKHLPHVEHTILDFLSTHCSSSTLLSAMNYSIEAGGKRFRPLLLLATLDLCQASIQTNSYQVAAALEMVHTYSLIHDDLPAMDNDDLRRGKPTNHKVFGDAFAILAGDALLTEAFHLVSLSGCSAKDSLLLLRQLAKASGSQGMVAGQVADIEGEEKTVCALEELQQIHQQKTGALIEYAVWAGGFLAHVPENILKELQLFAHHLGIAFQIKDDLLDVLGNEKQLGKRTGMDEILAKSTYPSFLGITGAQKELHRQCNYAKKAITTVKSYYNTTQDSLLEKLLNQLLEG